MEITLPVKWVAGTDPVGTSSFTLAQDTGVRLFLDGIWYAAEITLDGKVVGKVKLGPAPQIFDFSVLEAGQHTLSLRLLRPDEGEPKAQTLANRNWRQRAGVVKLLLGATEIESLELPLVGGKLKPVVGLDATPVEGASVEVTLSRDGGVIQSWEGVPVGTEFAAQSFQGERWDIGKPELYVGTVVLRSASGEVLDVFSRRYGLWEAGMQDDVLTLNGRKTPMMALRVNPLEDAAKLVASLPESGGNAVEIHGEVPDGRWLSYFDEWGVPVVYMPRCDGNLLEEAGKSSGERIWTSVAPVTREQDHRLLTASLSRPSVVAWLCEGSPNLRDVACGNLRTDPLHRPILGLDNAAVSIAGISADRMTSRVWVIEIGSTEYFQSFAAGGEAFLRVTGENGPGGVYFPPPQVDQDKWRSAWSSVSQALGVLPWSKETRRAMSVVTVTGLAPGELVYLVLPWQVGVGAAADDRGVARIEAWYQGEAEMVIGGTKRPVKLVADSWEGATRKKNTVAVSK